MVLHGHFFKLSKPIANVLMVSLLVVSGTTQLGMNIHFSVSIAEAAGLALRALLRALGSAPPR